MKSPRYWALQQIHVLLQYPHKDVEMKSPRYWALQPYIIAFIETIITVEMKSPRHWALQLFKSDLPAHFISRRKARDTGHCNTESSNLVSGRFRSRKEKPEVV